MQTHALHLEAKWQPLSFSLVVDDFGVKYIGKKHADNLIEPIRKYISVDVDCTGGLYCGIKLEWNYYQKKSVDLSISKFFPNNLHEFQQPHPKIPQHAPHK